MERHDARKFEKRVLAMPTRLNKRTRPDSVNQCRLLSVLQGGVHSTTNIPAQQQQQLVRWAASCTHMSNATDETTGA